MKLRVRYKRQRVVIDLSGEVITWNDLRSAVCREFGIATSSFDVSLNGQDILDETSESLVQLGVVSGDLVYILPNDEEQLSELTRPDTSGIASNSRDVSETEGCPQGIREMDLAGSSSSAVTDQPIGSTLEHRKTCNTDQVDQKPGPSNVSRNQSPHVLLCREGIPDVLEHLFKILDVGTIHKAVWVVIHVLMMETGYNCCVSEDNDSDEEVDDWRKVVPSADWQRGSLCRTKYTHMSCPGLMCSLTCSSLGPYLMIHGLADSVRNSEVYQCRLQPTDFVRGNVDLKTCDASAAYYNLHRLSRLVKDQVAYPLLSFMRATLGLPQLCGLMVLPTEVKLMIFRDLALHNVLNLSSTCRELHTLSNDSSLWEHFVVRDFGRRIKEQHRSWKMEYIHLYKQKKAQKQMQSKITLPPIEFFPGGRGLGSHSFTGDTFPPGIIGGHSDLYPNLPFVPGGVDPPPGFQPGPGLPRPRFDPFGPLPDNNHTPGHLRGRRPGRPGNFYPRFF